MTHKDTIKKSSKSEDGDKVLLNSHNFALPAVVTDEIGHTIGADAQSLDFEEFYDFSLAEIKFLQEYAKDMDSDRAGAAVGWSKQVTRYHLDKVAIQQEMKVVQRAWKATIKMTAEQASSKFLDLMRKFEKDYDAGEKKLAPSLANMAATYMKAVGIMDKNNKPANAKQTLIQINLGNNATAEIKEKVIENENS